MQKLQVRLLYRELEVQLYFKRVKNGEGDEGCGKICVRTEETHSRVIAMLGLQKVYIIQYDNCIPVFVHLGSHALRQR